MPLQKLQFRPGVNREATTYANEGGWYESEKVRFRSGFPEKIGGWINLAALSAAGAASTFKGVARDMWNWVTLAFANLNGVGTNQKFYIESGGYYNDVTPIHSTGTLSSPFAVTLDSKLVTVTSTGHGLASGTWVTFSGASAVGGLTLNGSFEVITVIDGNTYTIISPTAASATTTGGGPTVAYSYQISAGNPTYTTGNGWGAGPWPQTITTTLTDPFTASGSGVSVLTVTQTAHGFTNAVTFTGSVSSTTLTVTAVVPGGTLVVGQPVFGSSSLAACSYIVSQDTGTSGLTGTRSEEHTSELQSH